MKINMSQILSSEINELPFSGSLSNIELINGIKITSSTVQGHIKNAAGYMTLSAMISLCYSQPCDLCLKDTEYTLEFEFTASVAIAGTLEDINEEYLFIKRDTLDISERIEEEIYINMQERHLCSESCRGLCNQCGAEMNKSDKSECGCTPKQIDDKWAKIKMMLDQ